MPFAYIIHSEKLDKFYIGATNQELSERIKQHNDAVYGNQTFTAQAKDWALFLSFETVSYDHAIRIERKVKAMKSKVYINNLQRYSELKEKVFNETKTI